MTLRNIGISAHIDSGKTSLAECILFHTGRLRAIHKVRGRDGVGAKMDHNPVETDRGISIESAATTVEWNGATINLIDTPGHVDFTVEVERALAVLDGAVLLLSATSGVQAQTRTVDRQMNRHGLPRIAFVNKCDLAGADPTAVVAATRRELDHNAALFQLPLGTGTEHRGVIDLFERQTWTFDALGKPVAEPLEWTEDHESAREAMFDAVSLADAELAERLIEGVEVDARFWHAAVRRCVLAQTLVPVFVGAAIANLGVPPLLDAVVAYLPEPGERTVELHSEEGPVALAVEHGTVAYTFKVQETPHGVVAWLRVFQGRLERGVSVVNQRNGRSMRVGRLVRLHAGELQTVESADAGDIVAVFGSPLSFGDTVTDGAVLSFEGLEIPEPMVEVALTLVDGNRDRLGRALDRFTRQDPTIRVRTDEETGELRVRAMGELQLEVLVQRLALESELVVALGAPTVTYRATITQRASFDTLLKKQSGGPGQYARIIGYIEPRGDREAFAWDVVGGAVPSTYRSAVEKGFLSALSTVRDELLVDVRMVVTGGQHHSNDSSDRAFARVARLALLDALESAGPVVLEPVMRVEVESDGEHQGAIVRTLLQRRGLVTHTTATATSVTVEAEVPLAELFGYTAQLRSATGGVGTASLEFATYRPR